MAGRLAGALMLAALSVLLARAAEVPARTLDEPAVANASVAPAPTAEDVLAELVHASGAIFAGEVYAIRQPVDAGAPRTPAAPVPSTRPDAVDVEFRVDVAVRGTSVGTNYVLHMPTAEWQQGAPFAPHQRAMVFLRPADAKGLSRPVRGAGDSAAQPAGVLPMLPANLVDLSRLTRLVAKAQPPGDSGPSATGANVTDRTSAAGSTGPATPPPVPDVTTPVGRDTLEAGSRQGRMPELNDARVPFLALMRDVSVLSAAETPGASPAGAR